MRTMRARIQNYDFLMSVVGVSMLVRKLVLETPTIGIKAVGYE